MAVPKPGSRTLAEVNCQLVSTNTPSTARQSGPACPDVYLAATAQQHHPPAVQVRCPGGQWPPAYDSEETAWRNQQGSSSSSPSSLLHRLAGLLLAWGSGGAVAPLPPRPLAWHPRQLKLAAVNAAAGSVQVYDFSQHMPYLGQGQAARPQPLAAALLLRHELQQGARALAWRPNAGMELAVGCTHGVCLWHLGKGGGGGSGRSGGGRSERSVGVGGASLIWLQAAGQAPLTSLAWHPQGHLLAGASCQAAGFQVWDVATGACTPLRLSVLLRVRCPAPRQAGLEPVTLLRWSPCGSYLLTGHAGGDFRVWETNTWWSLRWAASGGGGLGGRPGRSGASGPLVDAAWAPSGRVLLLAHAHSAQLVSLQFTADAPSLQAQLLPVQLAELMAAASTANGKSNTPGLLVQAAAWDARGHRLAVAVGGSHPAAGCIALYDTQVDPILSARFIGFLRPSPLQPQLVEEEAAAAAGGCDGGGGGRGAEAGGSWEAGSSEHAELPPAPAADRQEVALAFHPSFGQGALLSCRSGDFIATIPMFFVS